MSEPGDASFVMATILWIIVIVWIIADEVRDAYRVHKKRLAPSDAGEAVRGTQN